MFLLTYLQTTYHLSRRTITNLIKQKKILINHLPVQSFKYVLQPGDEITLPTTSFTIPLTFNPLTAKPDNHQLLIFNKPKGYVVSKSDPHNKTIYELLPAAFQQYYYIGRLDKESRGLVLLTDSPELVHRYEHPSFHITKEYLIQLSSPLSSAALQKAKRWILDDGDLLKCKAITPTSLPNQYHITLSEGKKRHIRRIIKALWYELLDLQRIREGEYELGDLQEGKWKSMTNDKLRITN